VVTLRHHIGPRRALRLRGRPSPRAHSHELLADVWTSRWRNVPVTTWENLRFWTADLTKPNTPMLRCVLGHHPPQEVTHGPEGEDDAGEPPGAPDVPW
jgi:hypothetical protein